MQPKIIGFYHEPKRDWGDILLGFVWGGALVFIVMMLGQTILK